MNKHLLIFTLYFLVCFLGMAQTTDRCGSQEFIEHLKTTKPEAYKQINAFQQQLTTYQAKQLRTTSSTDTIIKIPVVVHIIHNNASGTIGGADNKNISDAQILSQISVINKDYKRLNVDAVNTPANFKPIAANVKLSFCLANKDPNGSYTTGITRKYYNQSNFNVSDAGLLSTISYWPSDQYLNIWVCDLSGSILGFAQPPGAATIPGLNPSDGAAETDGVVIDYKVFGTIGTLLPKYNLGRTVTHEIGHWFGLSHPWGDYNSGNCSLTDYCDDTPTCANAFEASYPACNASAPISCSSPRMIQNYMEYSDDGCMNLFTEDQKSRMRSTIELSTRRFALLSSMGCCSISNVIATPFEKDFEDGTITSNGWKTISPNNSTIYTKGFELSNTSAFGDGIYCTSVNNDSVYIESMPSTHKYHFSYESPFFNLKMIQAPRLRFNWAYSPLYGNGATDSIAVYISEGCTDDWVQIYLLYGTDFTSTKNPRALFIPSKDEWNTTEIDLSAYRLNAGARVKFVSYSKGINTFYLDNINIAPSSPNLFVSIFPNPTSSILNIETVFDGMKNIEYVVYNVLGQLIFKESDKDVYSNKKQLDVSFLTPGVYLVLVSDGKQKTTKKIIKQ